MFPSRQRVGDDVSAVDHVKPWPVSDSSWSWRAASSTRPARSSTRTAGLTLPHVFGYHEVFHALTLAAAAFEYAAVAFYVLPHA
jgi:predicted membrane channel-forming protein YqfA (hemolysin III family)